MATIDQQIKALNRSLAKKDKVVKGAVRWSLNRAATMAKTRIIRGVARQHKLQNKVVKKRVYIGKAAADKMVAKITGYGQPVPAISLGNVRVMKKTGQVRAGKHSFPSAFYASGEKGYGKYIKGQGYQQTKLKKYQVLQRTTDKRYPLEVVKIEINDTVQSITPRVCQRIMQNEYPRIANREISRRLNQ
ncbi:phage tail protein [Endozoicomonas sp. Mp262]|uniref:phage tail protein n=1 Tax=Endozoicomonas sp. Mp262 TaxID=2919499 RepID=UPI0021D90BFC